MSTDKEPEPQGAYFHSPRREITMTNTNIQVSSEPIGRPSQQATPTKVKGPLAVHLRPAKFNSTSTLFLDSTISKPKNHELIRVISEQFKHILDQNEPLRFSDDWRAKYAIFDETVHPLSNAQYTGKLPTQEAIEKHVKNIFKIGQLAHESLIMAIAYLDRIQSNTDFKMNVFNWKRTTLSCLILASKVWEDQAVWNVDFLDLFPLTTPHDLGQLEKKCLALLTFDVSLSASQYATIYFNLKAQHSTTVEHFMELKPLDKDGEAKLEFTTSSWTTKHNLSREKVLPRSTGSVDDLSLFKSPRSVLN
ncbi:cyclin domain-containing protein [Planoprotostelium fungivorum]|uniref:Cyclin domain-containing protein n=1 Tax=Planoprotostelium fungivorum TaxID=1890364 RepID=A0A2P6NZC7_9EUKA|nr:cyclin domain-containing protein [Planoprotostelium fungivorum]